MRFLFFVLSLLLLGCSPRSSEEFRDEGSLLVLELVEQLSQVHSLLDLKGREDRLVDIFEKLIVLDRARKEAMVEPAEGDEAAMEISNSLKKELIRLYETVDGSREAFEKISRRAMQKISQA